MRDYQITHLRDRFKGHQYVTKDDLYRYFSELETEINENTLRWRIHNLKENNVLRTVKRGIYTIGSSEQKSQFNPPLSKKMDALYNIYFTHFDAQSCIVWSTEWLAQFMELQPMRHFIVLEIEKELTKPLFIQIKERKYDVYLDPDRQTVTDYIMFKENSVVILPLLTRAPIQMNYRGTPVPTLEKILVDLFCDKDLFLAYQGQELKNIFRNAWKNYEVNLSTLMTYARRRHRADPLTNFFKENVPELYKALIK